MVALREPGARVMRALWKAIQLPIPAVAHQRKLDEIIQTESHLLDDSNRIETGTTRQAILYYFLRLRGPGSNLGSSASERLFDEVGDSNRIVSAGRTVVRAGAHTARSRKSSGANCRSSD
jgi:hypothetical protein